MSERRRKFHPTYDPLLKSTEYEKTKIPPYTYKPTASKPNEKKQVNDRKTVPVDKQIKLPILHEYDDRVEEPDKSPVTLSDPHHVIQPEDDKVRWFKEVFSEWRPPETESSARYDEAFMKWYNSAMDKELEHMHGSQGAAGHVTIRTKRVRPQSPTIKESDDAEEDED